MVVAAFVISVLALLVAAASAGFTGLNTRNSLDVTRRSRKPHLTIALDHPEYGGGIAFFSVRNDDQQDLDSVLIYPAEEDRPPGRWATPKRPVALMGGNFVDGPAEVGPIAMRASVVIAVNFGATARPIPDHLVRIMLRSGSLSWTVTERLHIPPSLEDQVH